MPTYSATDLNSKPVHGCEYGNAVAFHGKATPAANVVTGDKLRICRIAAGTDVTKLNLKHASLGTTVPGDIGYEPVDGSAGNSTAFASAYALQTAQANGIMLMMTDPVRVEKESFLTITLGTVTAGNTQAVSGVAEGVALGVK